MSWCLTPKFAEALKMKISSGEIDPERLADMTSAERRAFLAGMIGEENAIKTNASFERRGYEKWAEDALKDKPKAKRDLISKINKMEDVLNPADEKYFKEDLAAQRLGLRVTPEEASNISRLAKRVSDLQPIAEDASIDSMKRIEYGRAAYEFRKYMSDLKHGSREITLQDIKENPLGAGAQATRKAIMEITGVAKSLKLALNAAFLWRHGLKVALNTKTYDIYLKNAARSIKVIKDALKGEDVQKEIDAYIMSRPRYMDGTYKREKLAVGTMEEALPVNISEKMRSLVKGTRVEGIMEPFIRAASSGHESFVAFQHLARADVFDRFADEIEAAGGSIEGLGRVVNSMTDRGHLGVAEPAANLLNNLFFSPRYVKSNIDILTGNAFDWGKMSPEVRKQAALNTLNVVAGVAAIATMANLVRPGSVSYDSRSSDFMKLRVGDTRYEIAGGIPQIAILASRMATGQKVSSTSIDYRTGKPKVIDLTSEKFGAPTRWSVAGDFLKWHQSPALQIARSIIPPMTDRSGNPLTASSLLIEGAAPIPVQQYIEMKENPDVTQANLLASIILGQMGIGSQTYSKESFRREKQEAKMNKNKGFFR